jgi:hypothetical protein
MTGNVNHVIEQLLASGKAISSTEVARAAGASRQAAHKQLQRLVRAGVVSVEGKARACRYSRLAAPPVPLRTQLDVASAGSLYRLSARLLLDGVEHGEVTLDFTGVADLGDEFLEEIFFVWAPAHPRVSLRVAHLPARLAPTLLNLARRKPAAPSLPPQPRVRAIGAALPLRQVAR